MKKSDILKLINAKLEERKITLRSLGEVTDIPFSTLSRNLSGKSEITLDNFLKICEVLDLKIEIPQPARARLPG